MVTALFDPHAAQVITPAATAIARQLTPIFVMAFTHSSGQLSAAISRPRPIGNEISPFIDSRQEKFSCQALLNYRVRRLGTPTFGTTGRCYDLRHVPQAAPSPAFLSL
ncbi:MAG TPA: hypothetical protein VJ783_12790 [Pirellulales bacterium]|nr:hypothetical protein [Pirellulales bacterium]